MRSDVKVTVITLGVIVAVVLAFLIGWPQYNVYRQEMAGRAAYAQAEQDRRIRVLEAQAALDSAELTAQAEIARARGTNEANRIMAESLGGPDNYLRWSYINMLQETAGSGDRQIIYIPTEAGMPILEAGQRPAR